MYPSRTRPRRLAAAILVATTGGAGPPRGNAGDVRVREIRTCTGALRVPVLDTAVQEQAAEDDTDLRESLAGLSRLALGHKGLATMLTHVAEFAARAIPGADGAGLTLLQDDQADTVVASAEFVRQVDAIQYRINEGPCITAAAEGRTVSSGSLGGEKLWPRFGPRVGRLGVHSVCRYRCWASTGWWGR
jgi:hypothetical protein